MVNRYNYFDVKEYLSYLETGKQLDKKTVTAYTYRLKHLLIFADNIRLPELYTSKLIIQDYLKTVINDRTGQKIGIATKSDILEAAQNFYTWAKKAKKSIYGLVPEYWIENLCISRGEKSQGQEHKEHEFYSIDDMLKIAAYTPQNPSEERTQAAMCFLFLSGMRITAFCSLPVDCVNITTRKIEQKPSKGVETKFNKSATTIILDIPELLKIVTTWDAKVRNGNYKYWLVTMTRQRTIPAAQNTRHMPSAKESITRDIKRLCEKVGIEAKSPHKLRHGHVIYGIKHAKTIMEFKAISQNVMHSNMGITDGLYGGLSDNDMVEILSFQDNKAENNTIPDNRIDEIYRMLKELQREKA